MTALIKPLQHFEDVAGDYKYILPTNIIINHVQNHIIVALSVRSSLISGLQIILFQKLSLRGDEKCMLVSHNSVN